MIGEIEERHAFDAGEKRLDHPPELDLLESDARSRRCHAEPFGPQVRKTDGRQVTAS
jgi:hypothetical protein